MTAPVTFRCQRDVGAPHRRDHPEVLGRELCFCWASHRENGSLWRTAHTGESRDLVIGDSWLLHTSHGNPSDERCTVITLWYHPFFALLPAKMQAHIGRLGQSMAGSVLDWARIAERAPVCQGVSNPLNGCPLCRCWHCCLGLDPEKAAISGTKSRSIPENTGCSEG